MEYDILGCLLNSKFFSFSCSFGMAPSQLKMFHLSTSLPMMCTWSMRVLNAAGNAFSEKQLQVVHLVHHSPLVGADLDYNVIVEHVFVMTSWFSTPLPG